MESAVDEIMSYYTIETSISFDEIAASIVSNQDMGTITKFLKTLASEMSKKAQPEEDNTTPLAEDIFYKTLAQGLYEAVGNAQNTFREQTRLRLYQPTPEEVQAKIDDLLRRRQERLEREAALEAKREREGMSDGVKVYWMMLEEKPIRSLTFDSDDGTINVNITYKTGETERQKLTKVQYQNLMAAWQLWMENQNWQKLKESSVNVLGVSTA